MVRMEFLVGTRPNWSPLARPEARICFEARRTPSTDYGDPASARTCLGSDDRALH